MQPRMTSPEVAFFKSFLCCAQNYVEFGSGGSTVLACTQVAQSVTAVDSSAEWLDKVAAFCATKTTRLQPHLIHADIGPTGDWGMPINGARRASWPDYHTSLWGNQTACNADLYLVDGRFRVACFIQTLLNACRPAIILIHDFGRSNYDPVLEFADQIARAEDLSAFRIKPDFDRKAAQFCLEAHRYDVK